MAPQYNGHVATANGLRTVNVGGHAINLVYAGTIKLHHGTYDVETIRLVQIPPDAWEERLGVALKELQDPRHNVSDILNYLPLGTLARYNPDGQNPVRLPFEIGLAEEVIGESLEKVIRAVELWLQRKS